MSDNLRPYSEYKASGVEWLGDIPVHWDVYPHRSIFTDIIERGYPDAEMLSVTISQGIIRQARLLANSSKKDSSNTDKSKYKLVSEGDIAYNKMRAWQGAIGVSDYKGIISPAYIIVRLRENQNYAKYFHYLFRTPLFTTEAERWSYGITSDQWSLRYSEFKQIYSPLPPPDEQDAIVRFLDGAEKRIRRYIRAKQKLIKLLNEQKQAIIQQAVTRGLNPDAPMKDSGVEWLGRIPEHWDVRRVRTLVKSIEQGISPDSSSYLADENSWGVLKSGCANRGVFRETEHKRLPDGFPIDSNIVVHLGDVIISRASGSPALVGSTARVRDLSYNLILSDKTFRPVFQQPLIADFIVYSMNTRYYRIQVEQGISGAEGLANNLPVSELKDFRIAIPPVDEATEIVRKLDRDLPMIDKALDESQGQIDLIQEYRTRLIADVVTGKVDVRGVAFEMPEEFDDDDLLDEDEVFEDDELEEVIDGED